MRGLAGRVSLVGALVGGCTALTGLSKLEIGAGGNADAALDAEVAPDAGGLPPSAIDAAVNPFCKDAHFICEDFDFGEASLQTGPTTWSNIAVAAGGVVELTDLAYSPPRAFSSTIAPGTAIGTLSQAQLTRRFLGNVQRVTCDFQVRFERFDSVGYVNTIVLFVVPTADSGLTQSFITWVLRPDRSSHLTAYSVVGDAGTISTTGLAAAPPAHEWTRVHFDVDIADAGQATVSFNDAGSGPVPFPWRTTLSVEVAIGNSNGSGAAPDGGAQTLYDDVICDLVPEGATP